MSSDFLDFLKPDGPGMLVLVLLAAVVLLILFVWSIKRHRDPLLAVDCDAPLNELIGSLAGLTHGPIIEGNAVEVFENGRFFEALFEEIAAARHSVHFETFLWKDGELGRRLVDALVERRRAGVEVRVLVDARGGSKMGRESKRRLQEAGCKFDMHHPVHIRNIGVFNERDHRKLAVIDGRVAMLGGHCIVDSWLGDGDAKEHFRDVGVRLRGPAVQAVQYAFSENWIEETGELFVGETVFPVLQREGEVAVHLACVKPEGSPPAVKILHHLVICVARQRLWIQNPYFLPDLEAIEALGRAVARGVDVRVMVPSAAASDMPVVQHAAHRNFGKMLAAGVRIFEFQTTLLHQKMMTVDGCWCAIGSSNFDDRSLETNDEITLGLHDAALARRFEQIFERDMQHCVELRLETWQQRGLWHRLKDNTFYLFNELL
ncbi:phospholipase D-like domain-containing protein [Aquabacterium sp. A7-Y]|uniref:phospholipase D-like domain-containing protein n=1 Tax=Aquabacterium sp. A7-Y TaxID=1349605 RepID=UPI00223DA537|nr:phospholipase D-like domain-containing protein [Aquabacterium sp. A7-Y]MCW7537035.1 phospholipase D-like domain-containing protein [Aquabacterium sp. A7-Y]